ncbi:MAG: acyl-CoA-binding protein [Cytophaga sp.]|uniref:acyl-CoA-binding protein n=1 Tax=Cytophaga sp. TaxID=29535 RepID=UPI003F7D8236
MDLIKAFEESVLSSKSLPAQSNENLLKLYSLYKQATEGDVNIEKPTNFFDIAGIAKFNAWESLKGITKESAMTQYIDLVTNLGR